MEGPLIGITMGDPAGVGPEITVQAIREESLRRMGRLVVFGDVAAIKRAMDILGAAEALDTVSDVDELRSGGTGPVLWPVTTEWSPRK